MGTRLRRHFAANVVGYIALIVAVMGVPMAWALARNTVGTKQIKPGAVRSSDVKNEALTGFDVNESSFGLVPLAASAVNAQSADNATTADSADAAQTAQTAQDATNATNAQNAVNATNAQNANNAGFATSANSAFNADNAANLGGFPLSHFAGIGRERAPFNCNDDGGVIGPGPEVCVIDTFNLPRSGRVLGILTGNASAVTLDDLSGFGSGTDNPGLVRGRCQLLSEAGGAITQAPTSELLTTGTKTGIAGIGVSAPLSAGDHNFIVQCEEEDGDIDWQHLKYAIVLLGSA